MKLKAITQDTVVKYARPTTDDEKAGYFLCSFLVLLIDIPLSLSVDYHSQVYSMHDLNRYQVGGLTLPPHDP